MGIPKFRPALLRYFRDRQRELEVDHRSIKKCKALYIDVNSIIHTAIQVLPDGQPRKTAILKKHHEECIDQVIECLIIVIQHYMPSELLYLAVDGPAPLAKIKQQKERRYASAMVLEEGGYDSNVVSPGTEFMFDLDQAIYARLVSNKDAYGIQQVYYSSHLVPGEGEHKITKHVRISEEIRGSSVIYGNDADLILLALALNRPEFFVCSDTVQLYTTTPMVKIPNKGLKRPISIDNLREALDREIAPDAEKDFIFCASLLGNDFLPKSPVMSDIDAGLDFIFEYIKDSKASDYIEAAGLFGELKSQESFEVQTAPSLLTLRQKYLTKTVNKEGYVQYKSPTFDSMIREQRRNDIGLFRQLWYTKCFNNVPLQASMEPALFNMCAEYIKGLHWVRDYYMLGQDHVTWLWLYPYSHAPLFQDISDMLQKNVKDIGTVADVSRKPDELRFTSLHQLVAIMPAQSYEYIPEDLYRFYSLKGGLLHLMPSAGITIDEEFTSEAHQARPILPPPNYTEIMIALSSVKIRTKVVEKYTPRANDAKNVRHIPYNNRLARRLVDKHRIPEMEEPRRPPATTGGDVRTGQRQPRPPATTGSTGGSRGGRGGYRRVGRSLPETQGQRRPRPAPRVAF